MLFKNKFAPGHHSQFEVANVNFFGVLLVVRVDPLGLRISSLLRLRHFMVLGDGTKTSLLGSISEHLLASLMLKLQSIKLLLFGFLLLHELGLFDLHSLLEVHLILLGLREALEMVRLDAVRSQHGHLGLLVLRHKVVIIRVVDLVLLLAAPYFMLHKFALSLFLGEHLVDGVRVLLVARALIGMVLLGLSELIVVVQGLLIEHLVNLLVHSLLVLLLSNLLLAPVLLL